MPDMLRRGGRVKRIEVTFRVYDTTREANELQIKHVFNLDDVAAGRVPFGSIVLERAKKFWESIVLMGALDK